MVRQYKQKKKSGEKEEQLGNKEKRPSEPATQQPWTKK